MVSTIRVADEVWIATAGLHSENPEAEDFTAGQIVDRVLENNYFGSLRPGVSIHISQHCVADKRANPGNYLMLASSPRAGGRNRRLFRDGDPVGPGREDGKRVPYLSQIPFEQQDEVERLLEWWSTQEGGCPFSESGNPKVGTTPVKVRLNQIRLSEDIYPFFLDYPELRSINKIRDLQIAELDSEGNPIDRYRHRQTMIKVGYALKIIEDNGLLKRFEEVMSATGRTIKESYSSWYRENENQLSSARRVSSDRDNAESSEDDRGVDRRKSVAFIGARPEPQNTVPDPVFTINPVTANQIHLQNDIKPFLDFYSPENAQLSADDAPLAISELDEAGNPTAYFKDRVVTIRVGFLLAAIRNLGLIGEFEDLLAVSGRIINPRYEQMYQQNMSAIAASSKHNLPLSRVVDEPSLTRIPSHPKEIIEITESKEYLQRQYYLHSSDINLQLQACSDRAQAMVRNDIFKYLCLNLLSVNADWDTAMAATEQLDEDGHLFKGGVDAVKLSLKSAKYRGRGKADWLVEARHRYYEEGHPRFSEPIEVLIGRLRNTGSPLARRAHIKKLVSGLGMKTASHFLRGVNLSDNKLAILDSHVLKQLLTFPEIASKIRHVVQINDKGIPKHPSDTRYLDIEKAVIDWATHQVGIPMDALDLLLWRLGRSGAR